MEIKNLFLFFGIALAAMAVIVTVVGMRKENFPDRRTFIGLLVLTSLLVVGTGYYAVELSIEEAHEREKKENPIGEEASVAPLRIPAGVS
jgi:hypothetical protein